MHVIQASILRSVGVIPESKDYMHDGTNEENINFLCRHHIQRLKSPLLIIVSHLAVLPYPVYTKSSPKEASFLYRHELAQPPALPQALKRRYKIK